MGRYWDDKKDGIDIAFVKYLNEAFSTLESDRAEYLNRIGQLSDNVLDNSNGIIENTSLIKEMSKEIEKIEPVASTATYIIAATDTLNSEGAIITDDYCTAISNLLASDDFVTGSEIVVRKGGYTSYFKPLTVTKMCHIRTEGDWLMQVTNPHITASGCIFEDILAQYVYIDSTSCTVKNINSEYIHINGNNNTVAECTVDYIAIKDGVSGTFLHNNHRGSSRQTVPICVAEDRKTALSETMMNANNIEVLTNYQIYTSIKNFDTALDSLHTYAQSIISGGDE